MSQTQDNKNKYAQLCAALGLRKYLIEKLSGEIKEIIAEIDKLEPEKQDEPKAS